MPTETEFLNGALGKIGAAPISSINDQNQAARYCKIFYPPLLDASLRIANWNFAGSMATLAASLPVPLFKWSLAYELPTDWLRTRTFNGANILSTEGCCENTSAILYEIEGKRLLTNYGTAYLTYTKRVTDPNIWDALFYQYLMHMLASQLATAIPKDSRMAADLVTQAVNLWLSPALTIIEAENPIQPIQSDSLTWGR